MRDFIEPVCEADGLVSRDAALALLERSLARWQQLRDGWAGRYGYLRSYSFGGDHYQHTFIEVEQGAVVERRCRDYPNGQSEYHLYYEGPRDIGKHDECHAPLSIESLHEECRAIIEHAPGAVRFVAHPDGLLGICGLPESCCQPDSATCVSVRAAYRLGEAPCFDHALLRPQGWTLSGAGTVPSRACRCRDSMLACDDSEASGERPLPAGSCVFLSLQPPSFEADPLAVQRDPLHAADSMPKRFRDRTRAL